MDHLATLNKAELLIASGRYGKVIELLLPVCASSDRKEQEAAYLYIILATLCQDDCRRAIDFALKALEAGIDSPTLRLTTAWAYHNAELYQQALKHLQVALQEDPENSEVHVTLAQCYFNLDRYAEAEQHARRAVWLEPEGKSPLTVLAAIRQNQGQPKEALTLVEKALAIDPADSELLAMRALLENDNEKSIELFKRVLSANPTNRMAAREYRQLLGMRFSRFDGLLFSGYALLSSALVFLPQLTEVPEPRLYLWLYLPGAWIFGRNWRLSLPFFLLSFGLLSQVKAVTFAHWTPVGVLVMSGCYTVIFWLLHKLAELVRFKVRNGMESFQLHRRQGTMRAKLLEQIGEMVNFDSALVLLGSGFVCFASLKWLPGWTVWFGLLPVLVLLRYRGRKGLRFLPAMAPLFYGDLAIFLAAVFSTPWKSLALVVVLMLLQLYMFDRIYLRKVRYAHVG